MVGWDHVCGTAASNGPSVNPHEWQTNFKTSQKKSDIPPCSKLLHVSSQVFFLVRYVGRKKKFKLSRTTGCIQSQARVFMQRCIFQVVSPSKYWATLFNVTHFWHTVRYGKCKVVPVHTRKAQAVSTGTSSLILNLDARLRWVVSLTFRLLYPKGKSPRYLQTRRLGESQRQSGRFR